MKLGKRIAAAAAALIVLTGVAAVWVAQSAWLRERVRGIVVEQTERATGGRVELGAFDLDWRTLTARLSRFTVHGTEAAGQAPLLAVDRATVRLTILSLIRRNFRIDHIEVEHPRVHLIVYPDGRTNLPQPKQASRGNGMQTILDLKIGRFDLKQGTFTVDAPGSPPKVSPWSAQGRELAAAVEYDPAKVEYSGTISVSPLRVRGFDFDIRADAAAGRDRVTVSKATVTSAGGSVLTLNNAEMTGFSHPVYTAHYDATLALPQIVSLLRIPERLAGTIAANGDARFVSLDDYRIEGSAQGAGLSFRQFRSVALKTAFEASPGGLVLRRAQVETLGGRVLANAELKDYQSISVKGRIDRFELRQAAKLETQRPLPYNGLISGAFELSGRLDRFRPRIDALLDIAPAGQGPAATGKVAIRYDAARNTMELGQSWIQLPNTRLDIRGIPGQRLRVKADSR
ncbi:MAG: hypothetical protein KGN84_21080, partial [Acidobacteriota bacterium]|nr:hypothetical protein [Acidobacteriota bacterium]